MLECIRQGQIGGGESHLLSLVENLDRRVYDPVVLSFTDGPMIGRLRAMSVPTYVIHTERPFDFTKWKAVKQLLIDQQIELIHAHGTRAASNVLTAARSLGIPVIYTIHGWSFHRDQSFIVRKLRVAGERYLANRTALNICVSASNRSTGEAELGKFKAIVIHNGIDRRKFNPEQAWPDLRGELTIPAGKLIILFLARFTSHKQPLALIQAFAGLLKTRQDVHLLMVGDGDQKEEGVALVDQLGIGSSVTLEKFRQDVPVILAQADIFVLPSLWEGLPIGLLEAMTMGKAVIGTNVDGTKDVLVNGVNGMLIEVEGLVSNLVNALQSLCADQELRSRYQASAMETVRKEFDATDMTRKIEQQYQHVLASVKTAGAQKN